MAVVNALGEAPLARGKPRRGLQLFATTTTLAGSNPTSVTTPFRSVVAVEVGVQSTAAPNTDTTLTYNVPTSAANRIDIYQWKPSAAATSTLVAGTGTDPVSVIALGIY